MTSRKAVIFDLYGTLAEARIDEESAMFWDTFACDLATSNCHLSGGELKRLYRELLYEEGKEKEEGFLLDGVFRRLLSRYGTAPSTENLAAVGEAFRKRSLVKLQIKPYADEVLSKLRNKGYGIGLVSNTEAVLSRYDQKRLGLQSYFDSVILSSEFGAKKPAPAIFQAMLSKLGVAGDEAVFVGDSFKDDIVGCLDAGIDGIFLTADDPRATSEIEARFAGHVICAGFSASDIISALQRFDFSLPE